MIAFLTVFLFSLVVPQPHKAPLRREVRHELRTIELIAHQSYLMKMQDGYVQATTLIWREHRSSGALVSRLDYIEQGTGRWILQSASEPGGPWTHLMEPHEIHPAAAAKLYRQVLDAARRAKPPIEYY